MRPGAGRSARLNATAASGLASDQTLQNRGYDASPQGGHKLPSQPAPPVKGRKRRRRQRVAKQDGPRDAAITVVARSNGGKKVQNLVPRWRREGLMLAL